MTGEEMYARWMRACGNRGYIPPWGSLTTATQGAWQQLGYGLVDAGATPADNRVGKSRHDHGETAKAAAAAVFPRTGSQRHRVLMEIRRARGAGVTRDEIAESLGMSANTVRPRVKELIDGGWVAVHPSRQGRSATNRRAELLVDAHIGEWPT